MHMRPRCKVLGVEGPGFNLKANAFTSLHFDSTYGAPLLVSEIGFNTCIVYMYCIHVHTEYLLPVGQRPLNKSSLKQTAGDGVSRHASKSEQPFAARHQSRPPRPYTSRLFHLELAASQSLAAPPRCCHRPCDAYSSV